MSVKPRVNLFLDMFIMIAFLATVISGLAMDNGTAARSALESGGMAHLHSMSSFLFIASILVHQLFHMKWMNSQMKQLLRDVFRQRVQVQEN